MDVRGRALIRCSRVCWYAGLPSICGMRCFGVPVPPMLVVEFPPAMRRGLISFCCVIIAVLVLLRFDLLVCVVDMEEWILFHGHLIHSFIY